MTEKKESWLEKLWHPGVLATVLLMASLGAMGLIALISDWIENSNNSSPPAAVTIDAGSTAHRGEVPSYAAERPAGMGGGFSWPTSPSRRPARNGGAGIDAGEENGLSIEDYRAAIESGKTVYLPNPSGECNLGGGGADALSAAALANCFSKQAKAK